eukprot:s5809_g5.t1
MQILWFKTREGLGSPPRPADNNSASRYSRMLLWEYLWWTDIIVPLDPINWESSPEERQRACDEAFLTMAQGVHDKAAWQRRTALGFFQAMGEFCGSEGRTSQNAWTLDDAGRSQAVQPRRSKKADVGELSTAWSQHGTASTARSSRRATDQKVEDGMQASADVLSKLILASGISAESVKPEADRLWFRGG